jgi:hypothetical protein
MGRMAETPRKKPYTPPSMKTEKLYERRSLACAKIVPRQQPPPRQCRGNFRAS